MKTRENLDPDSAEAEPTQPRGQLNGPSSPRDAGDLFIDDVPTRVVAESDPIQEVGARERHYRVGLAIADLAAVGMSGVLAISVLGGDSLRLACVLVLPLVVSAAKILGLYDHDELVVRKSTLDEVPRLVHLTTLFALLMWLSRHFLVVGAPGTTELVSLWLLLTLSTPAFRFVARRVAALTSAVERCLVIGDASVLRRLQSQLPHSSRVSLIGSVDESEVLRDPARLKRLALDQGVHRIIIAPGQGFSDDDTLELVRSAKATGMRVSLSPGILGAVGSSVVFDDVGGITLLGVPRFGLTRSSTAVKRAFDLVGAGVAVIAALPIMLLASVLIAFDSPGPVLFRQTRVGRNGTRFTMVKFRTMVADAETMKPDLLRLNEAEGLFKMANDPRMTRVGKLLRRSSIDELPQLFNVLRGEMSLVGPRPLVVDEDQRITGLDRRRLHLTPGMTGQWQILGSARVPLSEMVKIDYLYVANWSLWADVKILIRTVPVILRRRGQ